LIESCSRIARYGSAFFVVARRGKKRLCSLLLSTAGARFPTLAAISTNSFRGVPFGAGLVSR
jgi:hypothetical protein